MAELCFLKAKNWIQKAVTQCRRAGQASVDCLRLGCVAVLHVVACVVVRR
jgi:hypothetical protein